MQITKIVNKKVNADRLREDIAAAGIGGAFTGGAQWYGFGPVDGYAYVPLLVETVIGSTTIDGVQVPITAQPGEVHFDLSRALTLGEQATLDGVLDAHVYTDLSVEQAQQVQDEGSLDQIIATKYQTFLDDIQAMNGTMTTAARNAAITRCLTTLGLAARVFLRHERGGVLQ